MPGAAFFSGVGRDGLGTFDRVEDLTTAVRFFGNPEDERSVSLHPVMLLPTQPQNLLMLTSLPLSRFAAVRFRWLMMRRAP